MKGFHSGLRRLCSILLGMVYFIAGMLKLMDPVGAGLVVEGYLQFLHLDFLSFAAKCLGVGLALLETLLGAALIAGVWRRQVAAVTSILTAAFTALTLVLVIFNPEMDCGCFGEAVHLSHMQTFMKNILLCFLCAGAFLPVKDYGRTRKSKVVAFCLVAATVALFTIMSLISIPLTDFTEFAPGATLNAEADDVAGSANGAGDSKEEYYVIYEKNGQEGAFTLDNLPDSTWTFVRVENIERSIPDYEQSVPVFYISDAEGNYYNELLSEGKVMVLSVYDVPGYKDSDKGAQFLRDAEAAGFTALAVAREPISGLDTYMSDYKKLITFNRSNGGATYLDDGEIICKWPSRRLPDSEELSKVASRNSMEQLVGRSSRRRIAFQGVVLYSLALLLIL
ncbi:MAG: DoxX family protein [Bacteroidales bacterium]|nr:DoxX family protein [Bacteroidales bacterium]